MDWKRIRAPVLACVALALSAAPALADEHSCDPERLPPAGATRWEGYEVTRMAAAGTFRGGGNPDFIIGSSGADTIYGEAGRDVVCAGEGDDVVYGGELGDSLHGQNGNDKLFGDVQDDDLHGGEGHDVLIGGHGTDTLEGGINNDWLRGGSNRDTIDGGENTNDNDVLSYADTPLTSDKAGGKNGVVINLTREQQTVGTERIAPETAIGNGTDEVRNVESIVGSAFDDAVIADPAEPNRRMYGGMGSDSCSGGCFEEPTTELTAPFAYMESKNLIQRAEPTPPDPVFIVVGGSSAETFTLSNSGSSFTVTATAGGSAESLATYSAERATCSTPTRGTVTCSLEATPRAGGQTWIGGEGADTMTDRTAAPNGATTDLDGATGSDAITGSSGSETIYSGYTGVDVLHGGAGTDAMLALGSEGDRVFGDEGNDQLAASEPCAGHELRGGPGEDIAGFARTNESGVNASLGNPNGDPNTLGSNWWGAAYRVRADGTENCSTGGRTWIGADNEILEGSEQDDYLTGNQNGNTIWGRDGRDHVHGGAGDDHIDGNRGIDTIFGEAGADVITGGPDNDSIHGEEGNDEIDGETENDSIWGGDGADTLRGGVGFDNLFGERDNDTLFGEADGDELFGGTEDDLVNGGDGADEMYGQAGNDRLRARDGITDRAVACGDGTDEPAEADPNDPVTSCG